MSADASTLSGGFEAPATGAAHAFRAALDAMARPGTLHEVGGAAGPLPLSPAAAALILTLCDADTPLFLGAMHDTDAIRAWLAFHTGAPLVRRDRAQFAVGAWADLGPLAAYRKGSPDYPDRSATLIVEVPELTQSGATLTGPGIRETAQLSLPEIPAFRANRRLFPLGLDFYFTCRSTLAALPRTTEIS